MADPRVQKLKTLGQNPLTEEEKAWIERIPILPVKKIFNDYPYLLDTPRHPLNRNLPHELLAEITEEQEKIEQERIIQQKEQPFKKIKK